MIQGFIGTHNPNKPDRTSFLQALGGILSPNGDLIYIPGELPDCLQHLSHEWQPVKRLPEWVQ